MMFVCFCFVFWCPVFNIHSGMHGPGADRKQHLAQLIRWLISQSTERLIEGKYAAEVICRSFHEAVCYPLWLQYSHLALRLSGPSPENWELIRVISACNSLELPATTAASSAYWRSRSATKLTFPRVLSHCRRITTLSNPYCSLTPAQSCGSLARMVTARRNT